MRNERRAGTPRASPNLIVNSGFEYDEDRDPAEADGVLTLEIPKVAGESSCFYQIVVE